MYIKQVIIEGFKSFKDHTVLEPFHPQHNVIVGRNGSGKSNLFQAIEFVLSDEYSRLKSDQLQNFLHEGPGPRVISAYVEIIFDNTDQRLPIATNVVAVRRSIGFKRDQYILNNKLVCRSEIMNLLETAGFSKSNPYYIVKQGKINQMATAPDSYRLTLLREVAGIRVFDDKFKESEQLLKETKGRLEKIMEFVTLIDVRLRTLQEEKEELNDFQRWDNKRRYIEYTIYDRELKENRKKLNDLINIRTEIKPEFTEHNNVVKKAQETVRITAKTLKEAKKDVAHTKEERDSLNAEQQELLKKKTKVTLTISDLRDEISSDNERREIVEEKLESLRIKIAEKEAQLAEIKPRYESIKSTEEDYARELALKELKRTELYAKVHRISQFGTREQKDEWIQGELNKLKKLIEEREDHRAKMRNDLEMDTEKEIALNRRIESCSYGLKLQNTSIVNLNKQYEEMTKFKDQLQATRKEQYRKESVLQQELAGLKEDLEKVDRSLKSMVGNSTLIGRNSVKKVIEAFSENEETAREVNNYYGLLIDNFQCDKSIYIAVEVTAGNRLFNHLIETDSFSTRILGEMNRQNLPGEAAFIPLNRINARVSEYPEFKDAIPMLSKINYDPKFDKAFRFIFGRTIICRNAEVATVLARSSGLDCVTIEGDQVSCRGLLTGGYYDTTRSRIETQSTRSSLTSDINRLEEELDTLRKEILETDHNIVTHITQIQKTENKNSKAKDILEKMEAEIQLKKIELATLVRSRTFKHQSLAQCASDLEEMTAAKEGFESELSQELVTQLSNKDQEQVNALTEDIRRLAMQNKEAFSSRIRLEAEKNKLEDSLTNNLIRQREVLDHSLQECSVTDRERKLEVYKTHLNQVENQLVKVNAELKLQNERVSDALKRQKAESSRMQRWKVAEKEAWERVEGNSKNLEKLASDERIIQKKIDDFTEKLSKLEALPSHETFGKLNKLSTKQLLSEIGKTNKELKKYSEVNKAASDQFMFFTEQRESFAKQKEVLDRGYEKIEELMLALEYRKYEAIRFTFKQVSKYFSEVFMELVPSGQAELVMQMHNNEEEDMASDACSTPRSVDSSKFCGVGIRVSFTGQRTKMREMNQLSGGEKSIVALALIFAVQKCDPAPFYLFDEIDQALDTEHRTAVANMIYELSGNAQFITTTFRLESLMHAHKFYGIKFGNKLSHVECITLEEAAKFVKDDNTIDEQD